MKILMIGGTGLIGSEAARVLIERGHEVISIALPEMPKGALLPSKMKIQFGNYLDMSEEELRKHFKGCDAFVFAAGVDERIEGPPPIYDMFKKYNIDPLKKILKVAKECRVKHTVICGSYFSYFDKIWPHMELSKWHPYIRSRRDQEEMALSFAGESFDVAILELPYIFGTQVGRKPVWVFLVEKLRAMKPFCFYPAGGTTMVTVNQVAQALAGAVEKNRGGNCYPIGYYNLKWKAMLKIFYENMGEPKKKIVTIPNWMFNLYAKRILTQNRKNNIESGLNLLKFSKLQSSDQFIDKSLGCEFLGVTPDDIEKAIGDSVKLSLEVIENGSNLVSMRGE